MKLVAKGDLVVSEFGCVATYLEKEDDFKQPYNSYTSGLIKYLNLPQGSIVRVTVELLDEGDE